ncbi:intraflagellar transport protein 172 homolog [Trichonephila clavipes]|uniref:Intraflagellar transport protein 172 homolog n=1 Tax=Trichonephila clavipes TaxID=2585209 RepID=A0A8X6S3W1_TRICX|nr:intraflagellar transport protein 172 homolog [Trichonephila clavipes]
MRLKHLKTLHPAQDGAERVMAMCWSPNNKKLAVCTADRTVLLFDSNGEKRDKFSTKPADSAYGKKSYVVKGMAFSPDSIRIAIAQSDNIVFVYKLGDEWGEKKVICNKFLCQSAVTCAIWPSEGPLVIGLAEGRVRVAHPKNNKTSTLYSSDSYVVSLTTNVSGKGVISGHADGSVVRFFFDDEGSGDMQGKIFTHTCPPYALAWVAHSIIVAGCDKKIVIYGNDGMLKKQIDYSRNQVEKEFTTAVCSPSGKSVVIGSFDRLRILNWSTHHQDWEEAKSKEVTNWYTICTLAWAKDGSKLSVGTLTGLVELFDCSMKKSLYKKIFEVTYIDPSQVIVRNITNNQQVTVKSSSGNEILDIKILGKNRYLVMHTIQTLILSDMGTNLTSEVPWNGVGENVKFFFDFEDVCLVFNVGELSLIEYGNSMILGSVRTEFMNPHLISVCLNKRENNPLQDNKKLAYLIDLKTIAVIDLMTNHLLSQITHEAKIDWLELSETGRKLLFRDRRQRLHLADIEKDDKKTMLNYCSFVQWVPGSDVVVAQSRGSLCVWYNIEAPDKVSIIPIKGEIMEIQRSDNKTDVIVSDGSSTTTYALDEGLIEFGSAIDNQDFKRAVVYLEKLGVSEDTEDMWANLGKLALESMNLMIAERCYAAVGDISKARFLRETISIANEVGISSGGDGYDHYQVRARLAIMMKEYKVAENIYLEQHKVEEAVQMYLDLHRWDDAIEIAKATDHPDLERLNETYFEWLQNTGQEEKAGELKENKGECREAIQLYLAAGLPTRAGRVITNMPILAENDELVQEIASALMKGEFYEHAGDLYEKIDNYHKALECYRLGNAFNRAVDLARTAFPEEVIHLEEEWGDHLASIKQLEAAINHYIEAGKSVKALDAAINAKLWKKAVEIMEIIDDTHSLSKYLKPMAQHFYSVGQYELAEHLLVEGGMSREAIDMYNRLGEWDKAYKLASQFLDSTEVRRMYLSQAKLLEEKGDYKDAEKLYTSAHEYEMAIAMYENLKQYDKMIKMIKKYYPEKLPETYLHIAKKLESDEKYVQAEEYYITAGEWKMAVNMYRNLDMWEDAYRVAKTKGNDIAAKQIAYLWAKSIGGDSAVKLLNKFGLLESAIDYAAENCAFDFAFELARTAMKHKLPDIHLKYAMFLEDEGKFREAEIEFIHAHRPKEAVLMYVHNQDWESAQRVAEAHDKESVGDVLIGQARFAFEGGEYQKAESLLLRAERADLAVKYYKEAGMWNEALRVCKDYTPNKLLELQEEYETETSESGSRDVQQLYEQASSWEESGQYQKAIDRYLQITPSNTKDYDFIEKCWVKAAELSWKFMNKQHTEHLIQQIAPRLLQMKKQTTAAQLFLKVNSIKNALDALIDAKEWSKAKRVAAEVDQRYEEYVDNCYKDYLRSEGNTSELADIDIMAALDLYAERNQWEKCLEVAQKQGVKVLHKYVALLAIKLIKEKKEQKALSLYLKYGIPPMSQNFTIYRHIVSAIFGMKDTFSYENYQLWANLRNILFQLCQSLQKMGTAESDEFNNYLTIAHYYANRSACMGHSSLERQMVKICLSLLRYADVIPVDKLFYEAGEAARKIGWNSIAFVCLNHLMDIFEAIEEGSGEVDNSDFQDTDIPSNILIPSDTCLSDAQHEETREWVLSVSMDQTVDQTLPLDERKMFESSLISHDGRQYEPCVVTGYPVIRNKVEFGNSNKVANKDDWNKLIMAAKVQHVSECEDVLKFIATWCGGTGNTGFTFQ